MTVKEVTYYTVVCDRCGKDGNADGEVTAWSDIEGAVATADGWDDWIIVDTTRGEAHYCSDCWVFDEVFGCRTPKRGKP